MLYPELAVLLNAAKLYIINLCTEQQPTPTTLLLVLHWLLRNHSLLICIGYHCYLPRYKSRLPPLSRFLINSESHLLGAAKPLYYYKPSLFQVRMKQYQQCTAILVTTSWYLWQVRTDRRRSTQRTSLSGLRWKNLLAVWNVDKWSPK